MYTSGKKRTSFFGENKVQRKRWKPENRILKSGIQPLMESGIHGCGIRNPQAWNPESTAWNPESKTLLDYLTWGEVMIKNIHLTHKASILQKLKMEILWNLTPILAS